MSTSDLWLLVTAGVLVVLAGLFAAAEAALGGFSRARAGELANEQRAGASRLVAVLDDAPKYLNTALFVRMLCEIAAIVLVTVLVTEYVDQSFWARVGIATGAMLVLSFEVVGIAEASAVIESEERRMIHSVFELGDTTVREVMVPRGDVVYIETYKNLRQTMSLFLRSGFSRLPVIGENLDDVRGFAYLKDVVRRDFEAPDVELTQRVEEIMRPVLWVPDSKPVDHLLREMQARRQHIAVVVDEYGGTAGLITIEDLLEEIVGE